MILNSGQCIITLVPDCYIIIYVARYVLCYIVKFSLIYKDSPTSEKAEAYQVRVKEKKKLISLT